MAPFYLIILVYAIKSTFPKKKKMCLPALKILHLEFNGMGRDGDIITGTLSERQRQKTKLREREQNQEKENETKRN